ncbi:O-antigen ligase family protein [Candidatus Woesebacteria bacterium]|jgi:O-antigen ligase|nr:O-antigen ligase family protein [Candidatus Woesebacteria bacterium]
MQKLLTKFEVLYDRSIKYVVGLLILAIPLYPKFPFISIPGTYVGIRLEDFLLAVSALWWFLGNLRRMKEIVREHTTQALILFWVIGAVSLFSALTITQTIMPLVALLHWARRIEYMICFLLGISAVRNTKNLKFYFLCIVIVVMYSFTYGVGQKYFAWPIVTTQNEEYSKGVALQYITGGHLVATFAGHYDMASVLILVLPLIVGIAVSKTQILKEVMFLKSPKLSRGVLFVVALCGTWLLANAASRISIVSFVGAVGLGLLLMRKYWVIPVLLVLTLLISALSGSLISRYMNIYDVTIKKVLSVEIIPVAHAQAEAPHTEDRSTNIRLNIEWPRAIRAIQRNPFLGTGYSSITLATDNDYIRMLGEVGILGSLSFVILFLQILHPFISRIFSTHKAGTETLFAMLIFCALPGIFLNMVFIDILEASKFAILFWLLLGISFGLIYKKHD